MDVRCETHIKIDNNKDDAKKLKDWASNIPDSAQIRIITQSGNIWVWAYWDEERPTTQMLPGVKKITAERAVVPSHPVARSSKSYWSNTVTVDSVPKGIHTTVWFNNGSFICACGATLGVLPNLREIT